LRKVAFAVDYDSLKSFLHTRGLKDKVANRNRRESHNPSQIYLSHEVFSMKTKGSQELDDNEDK
jgi:hypothetical protein